MASKHVVKQAVMRLHLVYPGQRSPEELAVITAAWIEDLEGISDRVFLRAVREVRRTNRFFPVPADVVKAADTIMAERRHSGRRAISDTAGRGRLSPRQKERNRRMFANLRARLAQQPLPYPDTFHEVMGKDRA